MTHNLFGWDYVSQKQKNRDINNTDSNWSTVFGQDGMLMHCKKDSYKLVSTQDVSNLANTFLDKGHNVTPFTHRYGEVIGLNISFGERATVVGDKTYNAILKIPNNSGGAGFLSVSERMLICGNGLTIPASSLNIESVKIPHNLSYRQALLIMENVIEQFHYMTQQIEQQDEQKLSTEVDRHKAMYLLNKWFFEQEMPASHKEDMTLNSFRELIATNPQEIKSIDRYNALMKAFNAEQGYDRIQNRDLSMYTVFASITNYLSRRVEVSQSSAPIEVQQERASKKVLDFDFV